MNNTAIGFNALYGNTGGDNNTAIGAGALYDNTDINGFVGDENTAVGANALHTNTQGPENTAIGFNALFSNTTAEGNTATGWEALASTTTGSFNTATGSAALISNRGGSNTATGAEALLDNSTGFGNTATGGGAMALNTTGSFNTANGLAALFSNTTGSSNVASGYQALYFNETGTENTATGPNALKDNRSGINNTANGSGALYLNRFGNHNTGIGFNALYSNRTDFNIAVGAFAGENIKEGSYNIDIGHTGRRIDSNTIRIGTTGAQRDTFIAGISGVTVADGVGVIVGADGHLGTVVSSNRFKDSIKPMDKASEAILALKPVTFRYKHELDPDGIPQFGLVAEDVEKVNPDLVARDAQGKSYTVRYDAVNAMLLNEFLKEHRKNEEQQAIIEHQQKQIDALTAGLQKVSAQLELNKSAPQTVQNSQ